MVPKVSVIMTTYNAREHVSESLDSVLSQTLQEIEVVVVDGHSTDGTVELVEEYSARDPRVRLIFQDRPTIGAAKNIGIEQSKGEFFTFLDGDDFYVDRDALERMYAAAGEHGVKAVAALRSTLYESDGSVGNEILHRADLNGHPEGVMIEWADKQYDYHFHSYIYHRETIINSDARFAEVTAYDDTHFFIRAMLVLERFYVVPAELYRYRCGPPYAFKQRQARDSIGTLTDQLVISAEKKLARLHWVTVQRINWEYASSFMDNIRKDDVVVLAGLAKANLCIDADLVDKALEEGIPKDYIEPMLHRNLADCPMRPGPEGGPKYILEPLWRIMHPEQPQPPDLSAKDHIKAAFGKVKRRIHQ